MKGSITPVIPRGDTIEFEYNPPEFESTKDVNWAEIGVPGLNFPLQQFVRGGLRTLSLEVYFNTDHYDKRFDVRDVIEKLETLTEKTEDTLAPPVCLFSWGAFQFPCLVGSINTRYTMFSKDGSPLEATVSLSLRSYKEKEIELPPPAALPEERIKKEPVFSGKNGSGSVFAPAEEGTIKDAENLAAEGETTEHEIKEGETVQSVATEKLGSPAKWRAVAFLNKVQKGFDKIRDVKEGIEAMIPDPRNPLGVIERITGLPPESMATLRQMDKIGKEGLARSFRPSLGVFEK